MSDEQKQKATTITQKRDTAHTHTENQRTKRLHIFLNSSSKLKREKRKIYSYRCTTMTIKSC